MDLTTAMFTTRVPTPKCGALTSGGTPCKRATIRGGTRCTLHGGGSPEARRVAEEMLAIARVPAARVLLQIIEDWTADRCETCGRPHGDPGPVIRAATAVLDRTGLGPNATVTLERAQEPEGEHWASWMTDEQLALVNDWIADAKRRMAAGAPRQDEWPVIVTTAVETDTDEGEVF